MSNEITLHEGTKIVGVNNIVITDLDGTLYVNNAVRVESSIQGSLAYYTKDGVSISGSGESLLWDKQEEILTVKQLKSSIIDTETVSITDFGGANKMSITKWLGFDSVVDEGTQPYKLKLIVKGGQDTLCFITNDYSDKTTSNVSLALNKDKFFIRTGLNIQQRTIQHSTGSLGDSAGDVAVDENYFYYCVGEFDGTYKIWRRSQLTEW